MPQPLQRYGGPGLRAVNRKSSANGALGLWKYSYARFVYDCTIAHIYTSHIYADICPLAYRSSCSLQTKSPAQAPGFGLFHRGRGLCRLFLLGFLVVGLGAALRPLVQVGLDEADGL